MADVLNDTDMAVDAPPDEGGKGDPVLKPEDQKRLDDILTRMKAAKEKPADIDAVTKRFNEKFGGSPPASSGFKPQTPQEFLQQTKSAPATKESTTAPDTQIRNRMGMNDANTSAQQVSRQRYTQLHDEAINDIESPEWKDKIFTGKVPALTQDPNMPAEAFQKVDPAQVEEYLNTKPLAPKDRYWLRNQILNYGDQRMAKYYIDQRAQKMLQDHPDTDPNIAYSNAAAGYQKHREEAIANRLNNVGLTDKPLNLNIPFHDQITGLHKAVMGTVNFAGDLDQQVSSLMDLTGAPGLSATAYKMKTRADEMKAANSIPRNGEAGNVLSGEVLPMALNMAVLGELAGAAGAPIYRSLAGARASGTLGKFAEGALGGLAVSPANSYLMAHQYYNDLIKQGMTPDQAGSKSDQLFTKNLATDILMTPLQMGLLKLPVSKVGAKLLEGGATGLHFTLQDFNQKSTDNPAMHIIDYVKDGDWKKTFITGAVLGMLQKAAVDGMRKWEVDKETNKLFSYNRLHLNGETDQLPANKSIANNILSAIEMKQTPGRVQELKDLTNSLKESGTYTPGEADRINGIIDDVAAVRAEVPKYGTPHQKLAVFNQLLENHAREIYAEQSGKSGAAKLPEEYIKEGQARIQRIMSNEEPLYFINGNETNKDQLLDVIEKHPELLTGKGVKIEVKNDPATVNLLKSKYDAIQKQSAAAPDVRDTPGDSETVVGRNGSQGAIDQGPPPESAGEGTPESADQVEEVHGAIGAAVNQKIASGEIPPETIHEAAKKFIDEETTHQPGPVQPPDPAEHGRHEDDASPRQFSKIPGPEEYVPAPGEGPDDDLPDQGSQSVSPDPGPPDSVKLTSNAKQLIVAGRTDDQILLYLKRKGLSHEESLAALGEAKANPVDDTVKEAAQKEVTKKYFGKEGDWLGRKDLGKVNSQGKARAFQKEIKESVTGDAKQKGIDWKDVDRAIDIYLDTKRNPEHFKEFYAKLPLRWKKIVDLSQHLNAKQLAIGDKIDEAYKEVGWQSRNEGLFKEALDNYVARAWDLKNGKPATEANFKFKTSTKHSLQRTIDTKIQGLAEGMTLKVEGATNNLQILEHEINNLIENRRHLDEGMALRYNTGEVTDKGKPVMKTLFTTDSKEPGYKKIDNPSFRKWTYAGKIQDFPEQEAQAYGKRKDVLIGEDGTIMKKEDVYAPEEIARSLNNILGQSKLSDIKTIQAVTKFNAAVKQSILSYSGFHFIAFTRAHVLSAKLADVKAVNPVTAYKAGLNMLAEQHPIGQRLIKEGMTINRQQDFQEGVDHHNTWLGKQADKIGFVKAAKDKLIDLNTQFHKYLFNTYGAGLKMFDGINLIKAEQIRRPNADPKELYQRVAKLMNDTYGGINWERMHGTQMQNPTVRHLSSLLLLAPDWTASNLRFARKAIGRGDEAGLYRRTWGRVILRGSMLTTAANAIMAVWDDKDDEGNPLSWTDAMARRYSKAWEVGRFRSFMVDITPLYHAIGGPADKRAYFSIFGAYTDPLKMIATPVDFLESKTSFIAKASLEALTSQNWQHKEFTTLDEFLGLDDKGTYTKTQTAHEKGEINPNTSNPYLRSQKGYEEGDEKGGKQAGELTKWPTGGAHPITWGQLPSFIGSQVRGMMPTALQNGWQIAAGENDAVTGLLNAAGTGVYTSKEPKPK